MTPATFDARAVRYRYPGAVRDAIDGVDLDVPAGRLTAVIGPNGSGKSTLLRLMLGTLTPTSGTAALDGRPLADWPRRELARRVGVVPQGEEIAFPLTVRELVAMGRYPHLGLLGGERVVDRAAIDEAMARCHVAHFADRAFTTLSGGERQRARIARALAQRPDALVLDEPTAALDVRHEMTIFDLIRELADRDAATILLVTHNLNLAARYADRLLLLEEGRAAASGEPRDVLRPGVVERVYRWPVTVAAHPGPGADTGSPQIVPLARAARTRTTAGGSTPAATPNEGADDR